jgi:chromate transporter
VSDPARSSSVAVEPRSSSRLPTEREALGFWLRLGCISFGGPAGQIAIMHDELVERRGWIRERQFLHALSFCFALPGPEAQQLATYVGWRMHGARGALAAGGLFVLPSFVLICLLSFVYVQYGTVPEVAAVVRGLGAAVVGLVLAAVLRVGSRVARTPLAIALAAVSFAALMLGVPFPVLVLGAALTGVLLGRVRPEVFRGLGHGEDPGDEQLPTPSNRRFRIARVLAVWLTPVLVLVLIGGVIGQLAGFFTLTALVTFGGAYAVLPFVADLAVNRFHWLSSADMVAGLALGETTPGPLIMVNSFVGYLAGWTAQGSHVWALAAAATATFCTFAPSFVFILVGAPLVDRIPRQGPVASALAGISIAVVGVIAGLAVFVGEQVLVTGDRFDWLVAGLAVASFIAAWRYRVNVLLIIAGCAAIGLVATLLD